MAFRTKKISQMDPKGSNLASTDLLEISQLVSGSYVTKSITGAQIAASAPAAAWGTITGTLSSQTDLNTALSGKQATISLTTTGTGAATFVSNVLNVPTPAAATFSSLTTTGSSGASTLTSGVLNVPTYSLSGLGGVPTSRTLTINGTTQDLSADRTFTISTGITIGTTAITSGTVGRVLFEGTGNVVQESANLFWDNTNGRLGIGGTPSTFNLDVVGTARVQNLLQVSQTITAQGATNFPASGSGVFMFYNNNGGNLSATSNFSTFAAAQLCIQAGGSKVALGTGGEAFTNTNNNYRQKGGAEFALNGTTQSFDFYVNGASGNTSLNIIRPANNVGYGESLLFKFYDSTNAVVDYSSILSQIVTNTAGSHSGFLSLNTASAGTNAERMRIFSTGNIGINTTTDAGYKLDVNGTARVQGNLYFGTAGSYLLGDTNNTRIYDKNNTIILQAFPNGVSNSETYLRSAGGNFSFLRLRDDYVSLEYAVSSVSATAQNPIQINRGYFGNVSATDKSVLYVKSTLNSNLSNATTLRGVYIDINDTTTYTGFSSVRAIEAPRGGAYFNTTSVNASAVLQADSTTQGFLCPRLTTTQKNAIASPATGLMVYDTTLNLISVYNGTTWITL